MGAAQRGTAPHLPEVPASRLEQTEEKRAKGWQMKAISIKQPWAWAILCAGKDIENRSMPYRYRGRLLIHASRQDDPDGARIIKRLTGMDVPQDLPRGAVIGEVELIDVIDDSDSIWFSGPYGLVLQKPKIYKKPITARGQLGLWNYIL